jgi:hypothetical protein
MTAIGFGSHDLADVAYLLDGQGAPVRGKDVLMASGQTSGITPNHRHPPGTVLVLRTGTGKYELATSANVDTMGVATITTSGHADGNGVIKLVGNHGTISVTTTTGSGTEANNATDLNGDSDFAAHYEASSADGELTIASRNVGRDEWFYMHADTMATAAFSEGVANGVQGTDPDVRVTSDYAELKDIDGTAQDYLVANLTRGNFDESNLSSLTKEAKAVLLRGGSTFG